MKLTDAADEMVQRFGHIHTAEYLEAVISMAARAARKEMCPRIATFHIREAMEKLAEADPMAPDYPTLVAEEPTGDYRDSAEAAPGAQ